MCGACGRTVVNDPVLGPVRTMRQHLIVAQTINSISHSWPGAPKVLATRDGWLVSGPTGGAETVTTVEQLWATILEDSPGNRQPEPLHDFTRLGDGQRGDGQCGDIPLRVREAGQRVWNEMSGTSAHGLDPSRKETKVTAPTAGQIAEITATQASTLEDELNNAVDKSRAKAEQEGRHGILVTRYGHTRFTIEISPEVPYGMTQERQAP